MNGITRFKSKVVQVKPLPTKVITQIENQIARNVSTYDCNYGTRTRNAGQNKHAL